MWKIDDFSAETSLLSKAGTWGNESVSDPKGHDVEQAHARSPGSQRLLIRDPCRETAWHIWCTTYSSLFLPSSPPCNTSAQLKGCSYWQSCLSTV